jgi:hypothetical protein
MKMLTSLRLALLPLLLMSMLVNAQQRTTFNVVEPFKKSTYGDQLVNRMNFKELKSIMMATGDDEIVRNMRKISGKRAISTTGVILGNLVMAGGLTLMLADAEGATGLLAGGAGVMLIGAIAGSGGNRLLRNSMLRYNSLAPSISIAPGTGSLNGTRVFGAQLNVHF